ncbi:M15 family metallopeptidase [Seleniivibrio sp.]|uniref:M15 family metallopeptidase n=1 Tax=Seleniivibrio sp. TaxID=2898801 RepID=UPI0025FDFD2B|nr:M15 family metallopeptidase [Seleniivibrio sp.]MCD8553972.1 M15 family metallopeptidase [Seleniivibrio sp.]
MRLILSALLILSASVCFALPDGFVYLRDIAPDVAHDIRYFGYHNFVGANVDGYEEPECVLTVQAAQALKKVQAELVAKGLSLKVYDCYRPQSAVDHFARWAEDLQDTKTKAEFYPDEPKETLFVRGFIAHKSGHSRGSTVDLTVIPLNSKPKENFIPFRNLRRCDAPAEKRFGDNSLDMGTGFDCFSPLSATDNPEITKQQRKNRYILKNAMEKQGFYNYSKEWWHYTLKNEPFKDNYFNFPLK